MKSTRWIGACAAVVLGLASVTAFAKEHGRGHGKDKQKGPSEMESRYSDHDREAIRGWYHGRGSNLPPGLAKRDELPPGLEQQLMVRGTLPPGLRKKMRRCPRDLVRLLPPPPPDCRHVVIGGHVVLLNRRTYMVLDIFHFEL
jgi:hypothetical protein